MVAITGGPCAGKTSFLDASVPFIEKFGMRVVRIEEAATRIIKRGFSPINDKWSDKLAFQRHVLRSLIAAEDEAIAMHEARRPHEPCVFLCDRGALDGIAYTSRESFAKLLAEEGYTVAEFWARYQVVVHLVTAADGAEQFYTLTNNEARSESPEQARELDQKTQQSWVGHPHHFIIDNSTDMAGKIRRALTAIGRVLKMPRSVENERAFLFRAFNPKVDLPENPELIRIVQTYLHNDDEIERRVRSEDAYGTVVCYYCEKIGKKTDGTREQNERQISLADHVKYLRDERDSTRACVQKIRRRFVWGNQTFELDQLLSPVNGIYLLERELVSLDDEIKLNPVWGYNEGRLVEVTKDPIFSMYAIAGGSLAGFNPAQYKPVV